MDSLHLKVDSIGGEVKQISEVLRGYLDHGIASNRKVQPPKTKAGRDLLQHLLGRLDQVSTGLGSVSKLASSHNSPSPSTACGPDLPLSDDPAIPQQILPPNRQAEQQKSEDDGGSGGPSKVPAANTEPKPDLLTVPTLPTQPTPGTATPPVAIQGHLLPCQVPPEIQLKDVSVVTPEIRLQEGSVPEIRLKDGSVYHYPTPSEHASPLFDCTYQDIHILNEELFELYSSHPIVQDRGYFKIQVRNLPHLHVQKVARPSKDHATSFCYKADRLGVIKVDTGKRCKFTSPHLPLPSSAKMDWSLAEQLELWNSSAADPPKGPRPYIIGNPLFDDVELSPGQKLRSRGRTILEGINTQYVYFNLTGKTITTMHREDAHVRSENLLRSGQHKFWCFIKPSFAKKLEERMALEYPEMRRCSQAVRHLSRHIPPALLDKWGIEYTLDYCVPGQAVVTEPGTYHQVLNLGPNYAVAINLEYNSSPDMPLEYQFCDRLCPDKFAMTADDFRIYEKPPPLEEEGLPHTPETTGSREEHLTSSVPKTVTLLRTEPLATQLTQSATPPPEHAALHNHNLAEQRPSVLPEVQSSDQTMPKRIELQTFAPRVESPHLPLPQDNIIQPNPPGPLLMAPSIPTPERSVPSEAESIEQSNLPQQPEETLARFEPFSPQPASSNLPTLETLPDQLPLASAATSRLPGPLPQKQNPFSRPVARAMLVAPPAPLLVQHHNFGSHGYPGSQMDQLPPIRKKERKINPKREEEMLTPRTAKRQRVELPPVQSPPVRGAFEHLTTLIRGRETNQMGSLAPEKLSGKPAFERLAHLVREWRRYSKSTPIILGGLNLVKSVEETAHGYPELHLYLSRLFKMKLAERFEQHSSQDTMDGMLRTLRWDERERHRLHDFLREGKCWKTICGNYDGILCLMPPGTDCLDLALFKDQVARFHAEMDTDFVRKLCAMGNILQKSIWEHLELPEFVWETTTTTWLSTEQISPLLAPFRLIKSNYYDERGGCYFSKPAGWLWDWPIDPTTIMPGDQQCMLCANRKSCRCIENKVPQVPRISDDRSKGPGIRAVGTHRANDILGELVGELVPVGTYPDDWTLEFRRWDLDDQAVAEIYPRRMGNWVRKVNHNTIPSASFRVMKISGRWRQMLVATRDIYDGEEITAKYGRGFRKEQPYSVVEGLH
jgi:hypothetical protein